MTSAFQVRQAARVLHSGGLLAYPTEAVWGLGCDPLNANAVYRLLELKKRPIEKGMILVAASIEQLSAFTQPLTEDIKEKVSATWPGPATWLLPASPEAPYWVRGKHRSIAVRVSDHPVVQALCKAFGGPIVSTSANLSSRPPAKTSTQVRLRCPGVDGILEGDLGGLTRPTPIRDAISGKQIRS